MKEIEDKVDKLVAETNSAELAEAYIEFKLKVAEVILAKEKAIEAREIRMDIHDLTIKLEEADKRAAHAYEFTGMVFKSPVFRTSYINSMVSHTDQNGNFITQDGSPLEKSKKQE